MKSVIAAMPPGPTLRRRWPVLQPSAPSRQIVLGARSSSAARRSTVSRMPWRTNDHHSGTPSSGRFAGSWTWALVESVGVELRPAVGRTPGEHELLVQHDLAVHTAGEVFRGLVDDHQQSPDTADPQVELHRLCRYRLAVVVEPVEVVRVSPSLEDGRGRDIERPGEGEVAPRAVGVRHDFSLRRSFASCCSRHSRRASKKVR